MRTSPRVKVTAADRRQLRPQTDVKRRRFCWARAVVRLRQRAQASRQRPWCRRPPPRGGEVLRLSQTDHVRNLLASTRL